MHRLLYPILWSFGPRAERKFFHPHASARPLPDAGPGERGISDIAEPPTPIWRRLADRSRWLLERIEKKCAQISATTGTGPQYVYVQLGGPQRVRLSTRIYYDPYQTKTGVRTVHLDLHGNPGQPRLMAGSTTHSYTLSTQAP